jgi:hypothetical protein
MSKRDAALPLATPLWQRTLDFDSLESKEANALITNLSALATRKGVLWVGGDEGRKIFRLERLADHRYGKAQDFKLADFGLAGSKEDGESDIEGLALDGDRLWLVGSHSLRRRKVDTTKGEPLSLHEAQSRNCHVLGCLRLNGDDQPVAGQRLAFNERLALNALPGTDALTQSLAADPRIAPFMAVASKENGLDIEGLTARGNRVLVGLRGPVLRGIALVLDLHLAGLECDSPILSLADLRYRYLDLSGLAVRDLAVLPDSDDVLILAGPTMTLTGPCYLFRWRHALRSMENSGETITVEAPEPLLWIRDGRLTPPSQDSDIPAGSDKPEGLDVQRHGDRLLAWVGYDDPRRERRSLDGEGSKSKPRTMLDGFLLPL